MPSASSRAAASSRNPRRSVSTSCMVTALSRSSVSGRPATASPASTACAWPAKRSAQGNFSQAAAGERDDWLPGRQASDARLADRSRDFETWHVGPRGGVAGVAPARHHVEEIDPGIGDVDGDLAAAVPGSGSSRTSVRSGPGKARS
jgi:hypothetical protein